MLRWRRSWALENLQGSIRKDLEPSERSVWADLLDLCGLSRRWGVIERSEGIPYTDEELAQMFITPLPIVTSTIEKSIAEGRLSRNGDGSLVVTNWDKYQPQKAKRAAELSSLPNEAPMDIEERTKAQELAASRLGYLQPDAAQKGIDRKKHEQELKGQRNE